MSFQASRKQLVASLGPRAENKGANTIASLKTLTETGLKVTDDDYKRIAQAANAAPLLEAKMVTQKIRATADSEAFMAEYLENYNKILQVELGNMKTQLEALKTNGASAAQIAAASGVYAQNAHAAVRATMAVEYPEELVRTAQARLGGATVLVSNTGGAPKPVGARRKKRAAPKRKGKKGK